MIARSILLASLALVACSNGGGSGSNLEKCTSIYSGDPTACTVGVNCSPDFKGPTHVATCDSQTDGGVCKCGEIEAGDAGPKTTVPFSSAVCAPLQGNDPTPNAEAANAACGWGL